MSDALWHAEEVLRIVRGSCLHEQNWAARGVAADSHAVRKGDLFIALQDHGHAQVGAAIERGAVAAIVARQPAQVPPDARLIFVEDAAIALREMALVARARASGKIIAIGSGVYRDMLQLALGAVGHTFSMPTENIFLALANLPPAADYVLLPLAESARPAIAVIPEDMGTADFSAGCIALLDKAAPTYATLAAAARAQGIKKIMTYADEGKADAYLIDCALTPEGSAVNAVIAGAHIHYAIGSPGLHLVQQSLPVLLAASLASGKIDECAAALRHYSPPIAAAETQQKRAS